MSLLSESGKLTAQAFLDWVNADTLDIPPEIVYPPKKDDHHGHGHDDHGHDEHAHDAHGGGHEHEEHAHDACGHDEHGHGEHGDSHGHEEHGHDDHGDSHGHEEHGHDDHGHHGTPSLPQPSREEVREEQIAAFRAREEARRRERAEKVAAAQKLREEAPREAGIVRAYRLVAITGGLLFALILLATVATLPRFGSPDAPTVNEVSRRYLEKGLVETGAVNAVAGVILDYRAFDTLGESVVLFTATVAVFFLLQQMKRKDGEKTEDEREPLHKGIRSLPARVVLGMTFPLIMLYGVYIVLNGHLTPGGFSGGVILGGGLVLSHVVFGEDYARKFITVERCARIIAGGLFVYIGLKTFSILMGASGIKYVFPLGTPGSIFSSGLILPLNICVGVVVACTIYTLYNLFFNCAGQPAAQS